MNKRINSFLLIGLIATFTFGTTFFTNLYRAFWSEHNIWWTPQTMRLQIEETRGNFELYIDEKLLQNHLSEGTLFAVGKNGEQYRIASEDVGVRLNNWDKIKSSILTNAMLSGFAFGAAITLMIIGLSQVFVQKKKSC